MRRKRGSVGARPGREGLYLRWWDSTGKCRSKRAASDDQDEAQRVLKRILDDEGKMPAGLGPDARRLPG